MTHSPTSLPRRHLPVLTDDNRAFWQSGESGELRISRCQDCGLYIHPTAAACRRCGSRNVVAEAVSGEGVVSTFTVNRHPWEKDLTEPFLIAIVTLVEQAGLNLMTNIVNCPIEDVHIGMNVRVVFEHIEDVWLPVFEPIPPT